MNILIADNEEGFLFMAKRFLTKKGHYVQTTTRSSTFFKKLKTMNIDVVVLNVKMKDMSSIDILQQIKRRFPLVQTIITTRSHMVNAAIEFLKLGATDYLIKPIDDETFIQKVKEALEERQRLEEKIRETQIRILEKNFK